MVGRNPAFRRHGKQIAFALVKYINRHLFDENKNQTKIVQEIKKSYALLLLPLMR